MCVKQRHQVIATQYQSGDIIAFKKIHLNQILISIDNSLYSLALNEKTMTKIFETTDEFDPIISINKVKIGGRWIALLSTLRCLMIAVDV